MINRLPLNAARGLAPLASLCFSSNSKTGFFDLVTDGKLTLRTDSFAFGAHGCKQATKPGVQGCNYGRIIIISPRPQLDKGTIFGRIELNILVKAELSPRSEAKESDHWPIGIDRGLARSIMTQQ